VPMKFSLLVVVFTLLIASSLASTGIFTEICNYDCQLFCGNCNNEKVQTFLPMCTDVVRRDLSLDVVNNNNVATPYSMRLVCQKQESSRNHNIAFTSLLDTNNFYVNGSPVVLKTERLTTAIYMGSANELRLTHNGDGVFWADNSEIPGLTFFANLYGNDFTGNLLNYRSNIFTPRLYVFDGEAEFVDYAAEVSMGAFSCSSSMGTSRYFKNCSPDEQSIELTEETFESKVVSASQPKSSGYSLSVGITKGIEISLGASVGVSAISYSAEASLETTKSAEISNVAEISSSYEKSNAIEFSSQTSVSETLSLVLAPETTTVYSYGLEVCTRNGVYSGCLVADCSIYTQIEYEETVSRNTRSIDVLYEC